MGSVWPFPKSSGDIIPYAGCKLDGWINVRKWQSAKSGTSAVHSFDEVCACFRADWKRCQLGPAEEQQRTNGFKEVFKQFDLMQ